MAPGPAPGPCQLPARLAEQLHRASRGGRLAGDQPHEGGLARSVAAHQTVDLSFFHRDTHVVQRPALPIGPGQAMGSQYDLAHNSFLPFL